MPPATVVRSSSYSKAGAPRWKPISSAPVARSQCSSSAWTKSVRRGTRVPAAFEGVELTRIGEIRRGVPGEVRLDGSPLAPLGYDHF